MERIISILDVTIYSMHIVFATILDFNCNTNILDTSSDTSTITPNI